MRLNRYGEEKDFGEFVRIYTNANQFQLCTLHS